MTTGFKKNRYGLEEKVSSADVVKEDDGGEESILWLTFTISVF